MRNAVSLSLAAMPAMRFDLAEIRRKRELLFPAQLLFWEHHDMMDVKRLTDLLPLSRRQWRNALFEYVRYPGRKCNRSRTVWISIVFAATITSG